jgi:hypothetical protein
VSESILEATVSRCTKIEECLRLAGGEGIGMSELIDSISTKLPGDLIRRVRDIAAIRNRFVHEHGYRLSGSESAFVAELDSVIAAMTALLSPGRTVERLSKTGVAVPKQNPWVRVVTKASEPRMTWYKWPSEEDERLVFFRGVVADVRPVGRHQVPILSGIRTIAYVRTSPERVPIEGWKAISADGHSIDIVGSVTMRVRPDDRSIGRVAIDGIRESQAEAALILDHVHRAVQGLVSKSNLADIRLDNVQASVEKDVVGTARIPGVAFDIANVTLSLVQSSDRIIREAQEERRRTELQIEHAKRLQDLDRAADELRRERDQLDWNAEKRRDEEKIKLTTEAERAKREFVDADRKHDLERLRIENDHALKMVEAEKAAEVEKFKAVRADKTFAQLVDLYRANREMKWLAQFIEERLGLTLDIGPGLKGLGSGSPAAGIADEKPKADAPKSDGVGEANEAK